MLGYEEILSRDAFLLGVELRLFWAVAFAYGLSLVVFVFHVLTRSASVGRAAKGILWAAAVAQLALIVFRTLEAGRGPFQTLYESLSIFTCTAALTYLIASRRWKDVHLPGLFVSALSMGGSLYALLSRSPAVKPLSPPLQSYWFEYHVLLAFFSYAVFVVGAAVEASYLLVRPSVRRGAKLLGFSRENLEDFRSSATSLIAFGFPFLTFTIFSGAVWANDAWGRYWSWDPKETWSLITWTVYAIYLHSRAVPSWRDTPASVFNLVGFVCMMMTFLGVNWLAKLLGIPSLHVYAV